MHGGNSSSLVDQVIREPYKNWAEGHIGKIRSILNGARTAHTEAVKERIESVEQMKDVVPITQGLFELSKASNICYFLSYFSWTLNQETAKLESDIFVQRQKVALASEVKSVLDSWVRHEQQVKENEQAQLVKAIIDRVMKDLSDEKTQREILSNAVAEVERERMFTLFLLLLNLFYRACEGEGYLGHLMSN